MVEPVEIEAVRETICKGCGRTYVVEPGERDEWCGCSFIPKDAPEWMKEPFKDKEIGEDRRVSD